MQNILIRGFTPLIYQYMVPYHISRIKFYEKYCNPSNIHLLLHTSTNYFLIDLTIPFKGYSSCTPLFIFKRDVVINRFLFEEELYPSYKDDTDKRAWLDSTEKVIEANPWIVYTLGCDDGDKGWAFPSEKKATAFIEKIRETTKQRPDDFSNYFEFLEYFEENQMYSN